MLHTSRYCVPQGMRTYLIPAIGGVNVGQGRRFREVIFWVCLCVFILR